MLSPLVVFAGALLNHSKVGAPGLCCDHRVWSALGAHSGTWKALLCSPLSFMALLPLAGEIKKRKLMRSGSYKSTKLGISLWLGLR